MIIATVFFTQNRYKQYSENRYKLLLKKWLDMYLKSGTKLSLVVMTDSDNDLHLPAGVKTVKILYGLDVLRKLIKETEQPHSYHPLNLVDWYKAQAYRIFQEPLLIIDLDAFIQRSLDSIESIKGDLLMAEDAVSRQFSFGCELNAGVMLIRIDIWQRFIENWLIMHNEFTKYPNSENEITPTSGQFIMSRIWHDIKGKKLPRGWNWSYRWGPNSEAFIYHHHGMEKFSNIKELTE